MEFNFFLDAQSITHTYFPQHILENLLSAEEKKYINTLIKIPDLQSNLSHDI